MTTLFAAVLLVMAPTNADDGDTKHTPEDAVAIMRSLLAKGEFRTFYDSHCHRHLRDQVDGKRFVEFMRSPRGKPILDLFVAVDTAVKEKRGRDVLIAQHQDNADEYEFILPQVKSRYPGDGQQWHLELMKEDDRWKLKDAD
jgi:hypothetical protein